MKGIYGTVVEEGIRTVVGVTQGDCSLTHALLEILETEGVDVIRFDYPYARVGDLIDREIAKLESRLGVTRDRTEAVRRELLRLRRSPRLSAELHGRIKDLLAFELSDSVLRGSALVRYNFWWDRVVDRNAGSRTVYRYSLHEILGSGRFAINLPFSQWRFKSSAGISAL